MDYNSRTDISIPGWVEELASKIQGLDIFG